MKQQFNKRQNEIENCVLLFLQTSTYFTWILLLHRSNIVSEVASEFQDVPVKLLGRNLEAADRLVALLSTCTDVQTKALLQEHLRFGFLWSLKKSWVCAKGINTKREYCDLVFAISNEIFIVCFCFVLGWLLLPNRKSQRKIHNRFHLQLIN